ncbi:MAG TPA: hypothetical protein DD670_10715 [Planctomycetaceae bacterium]|nr:hypothetical protein [Planctomycetaceae bacterium]
MVPNILRDLRVPRGETPALVGIEEFQHHVSLGIVAEAPDVHAIVDRFEPVVRPGRVDAARRADRGARPIAVGTVLVRLVHPGARAGVIDVGQLPLLVVIEVVRLGRLHVVDVAVERERVDLPVGLVRVGVFDDVFVGVVDLVDQPGEPAEARVVGKGARGDQVRAAQVGVALDRRELPGVGVGEVGPLVGHGVASLLLAGSLRHSRQPAERIAGVFVVEVVRLADHGLRADQVARGVLVGQRHVGQLRGDRQPGEIPSNGGQIPGRIVGIRWPDVPREVSAGITLAALMIPLNIGYAQVAGLPPVVGLYAAIIPLVVFALFTTSRHVVGGPDASIAALVGAALLAFAAPEDPLRVQYAQALAAQCGLREKGGRGSRGGRNDNGGARRCRGDSGPRPLQPDLGDAHQAGL